MLYNCSPFVDIKENWRKWILKLHGVPPYSIVPTLTSSGEFKHDITSIKNLIGVPCIFWVLLPCTKSHPSLFMSNWFYFGLSVDLKWSFLLFSCFGLCLNGQSDAVWRQSSHGFLKRYHPILRCLNVLFALLSTHPPKKKKFHWLGIIYGWSSSQNKYRIILIY